MWLNVLDLQCCSRLRLEMWFGSCFLFWGTWHCLTCWRLFELILVIKEEVIKIMLAQLLNFCLRFSFASQTWIKSCIRLKGYLIQWRSPIKWTNLGLIIIFNFGVKFKMADSCVLFWLLYIVTQKSLLPFSSFFSIPFVFFVHSKKSTEQMKKVPTIVLSVSYKGVKFIDATNKVFLTAHFWWRLL